MGQSRWCEAPFDFSLAHPFFLKTSVSVSVDIDKKER
jgi:hypothetical protein